jgi:hypothetical protein
MTDIVHVFLLSQYEIPVFSLVVYIFTVCNDSKRPLAFLLDHNEQQFNIYIFRGQYRVFIVTFFWGGGEGLVRG